MQNQMCEVSYKFRLEKEKERGKGTEREKIEREKNTRPVSISTLLQAGCVGKM